MVPDSEGRLTSWKTIAAYLQCNERTVKRWEQERALPIRRLPGTKRGGVFAYDSELDAWLRAEKEKLPSGKIDADDPGGDSGRRPRPWLGWGLGTSALLIALSATLYFVGKSRLAHGYHRPTDGAEELYLRGRYLWNLRTADSLAKAVEAFTQSILTDPSYAEAYAGLAETYDILPQFGQADVGESLTKAIVVADRAIELNPNLADAHRAKAFAAFFWNWDIRGSDAEFRKAIALDPNSAQTHHWYASSLERRLEGPECLREISEALRLNPTSAAIATDAALFRADFGDLGAGLSGLREIERTQPNLLSPSAFLRELDFARGDYPAYIDDVRRYASITNAPDDRALADAVAVGWARAGKTGLLEAKAIVLKQAFAQGTEPGFKLGQTLFLLGHQKEALPFFRAALEKHCIELITMANCTWAKDLISDPDYVALFDAIRARVRGRPAVRPAVVAVSFRLPE